MYPITLDLKNKPVLIIGAGKVGERKILAVNNAGANVTVLSDTFSDSFRKLAQRKNIRLIERSYQQGDCSGYFMVIGSTDDADTNLLISLECTKLGILVNIVDNPELCSFFVPAVVQRFDFQIAVSTGGKSPALAREIRKELEELYGEMYGELTGRLGKIRETLKQKYKKNRAELSRNIEIRFKEEYHNFKKGI